MLLNFLGLEINKIKKNPTTFESSNEYKTKVNNYVGDLLQSFYNGDKFPGSFGLTKDYEYVDYYTLRKRSVQLFKDNPYARGIIRRLLRNEINSGLVLEANAIPKIVGLSEDEATIWDGMSETDFNLWGNDPLQCDYKKLNTIGKLAEQCRQTSLISGDCLVVLKINKITGLPMVQLIDGEKIKNPLGVAKHKNNRIVHGVELDKNDRHVAFHVQSFENGKYKSRRIPAYGEKSGRKISWLVYGTDKRLDAVRGEPILALVLYMMKELDRALDSEQRAATINGMLPMFIKKTEKSTGSNPFGSGAIKKTAETVTDSDGSTREVNISGNIPGIVPRMAYGEEPVSVQTQRPNVNFKVFQEMIINTFAWALELPPEIARLLFTNSFAASRQANNEFNVYLQYRFNAFGNEFYQPIYNERLISAVLLNQLEAPGLIDAWRDKRKWRIVGGWTSAVWEGISRPSVDIQKDMKAAELGLKIGVGSAKWWNKRITGQRVDAVYRQRSKEIKLAQSLNLSFASEENNNGEPILTSQNDDINNKLDDIIEQTEKV